MNVKLAAQTLSQSVADAIEFLDKSQKLISNGRGTVHFIQKINRLFDMLNSRNPVGKGFKEPLNACHQNTWQAEFISIAKYLLLLKIDTIKPKLLSQSKCKAFVIGFVICIK